MTDNRMSRRVQVHGRPCPSLSAPRWLNFCEDGTVKVSRAESNAKYYAAHREEERKRSAKYQAVHREEIRIRKAKYRAAYPERGRAAKAKYTAAHPERLRAYYVKYRATHLQEVREQDRAHSVRYRATPKGKDTARRGSQKHRALKYGNTPADRMLTREQWEAILKASKGRCYWCGKRRKPTMDHVIPLVKGGEHTAENVVVSCMKCNLRKHVKIITLF